MTFMSQNKEMVKCTKLKHPFTRESYNNSTNPIIMKIAKPRLFIVVDTYEVTRSTNQSVE